MTLLVQAGLLLGTPSGTFSDPVFVESVSSSGGPGAPGSLITITRPANQTAYPANGVIGGTIEFTNMGSATGGKVLIMTARLQINIAAIPSGMTSFYLACFSATPPSALTNTQAWSGQTADQGVYLGLIPLGAPVDLGSMLDVSTTAIQQELILTGSSMFAYLITTGAYTPAANSEVYNVGVAGIGV